VTALHRAAHQLGGRLVDDVVGAQRAGRRGGVEILLRREDQPEEVLVGDVRTARLRAQLVQRQVGALKAF